MYWLCMENNELKLMIKKLAKEREKNQLLSDEMQGYMKDSKRRKIFREGAKHKITYKKKYAYIDQDTSGKFLVQQSGAEVGVIFGIKAYGHKGRYVGQIKDVIKSYEKTNAKMVQEVMDRALRRKK